MCLGRCVSIFKRHIYTFIFCVLFCANKKKWLFLPLTDPCPVKHPDVGQSKSSRANYSLTTKKKKTFVPGTRLIQSAGFAWLKRLVKAVKNKP